jgi:hypothetical protein
MGKRTSFQGTTAKNPRRKYSKKSRKNRTSFKGKQGTVRRERKNYQEEC